MGNRKICFNEEVEMTERKKYKAGKLYLKSLRNEFNENEYGCIFDDSTNNFHLYPYEEENILAEMQKCINDIMDELKKNSEIEIVETRAALEQRIDEEIGEKILIYTNNKKNGGYLNCDYKRVSNLYRYITAYKNGVIYELNLMRYFCDKENRVNCIINAIQYDRIVKSNSIKLFKKTINYNGLKYPTSYENQRQLEKKITDNKEKDFCYNPPVNFDDIKGIAENFISFINLCDQIDKNV